MGFQKFFQFLIPTINQNARITKLEMASCFTFIFLLVHCVQASLAYVNQTSTKKLLLKGSLFAKIEYVTKLHAVPFYKERSYKERLVDLQNIKNGDQSIFRWLKNVFLKLSKQSNFSIQRTATVFKKEMKFALTTLQSNDHYTLDKKLY